MKLKRVYRNSSACCESI